MAEKAIALIPTLARRFLQNKTSDGFLSLISWVSVVGVSLGVLALVVVTSVINGFEGELVHVITGMQGAVNLYTRADPIAEPTRIMEKIKKVVPQVDAITPAFQYELMASGPQGVAGSIIEGVDVATASSVTDIEKQLVSGRLPGTGQDPTSADVLEVALGSALSQRLGASAGTLIRLIIPSFGSGGNGGGGDNKGVNTPKIVKARVVGIVNLGMYEYDSKYIFSTLSTVQKLVGYPDKVTTFKMTLKPGADSREAADRLSDYFGFPFRAKDWSQMHKNLFYAIQLEKAVIAIILTAIVIVASFNVVSTLMMMIHDKTREIAILKTMGFRPSQSFRLFCYIGMGMGLVGTVAGVGMGLGINWVLKHFHLINLPADIYYIGFLPVVVHWKEIGMIALASMAISFLATLYPAFAVSRRSPMEGLKYER